MVVGVAVAVAVKEANVYGLYGEYFNLTQGNSVNNSSQMANELKSSRIKSTWKLPYQTYTIKPMNNNGRAMLTHRIYHLPTYMSYMKKAKWAANHLIFIMNSLQISAAPNQIDINVNISMGNFMCFVIVRFPFTPAFSRRKFLTIPICVLMWINPVFPFF